jgi:hypothetical protein
MFTLLGSNFSAETQVMIVRFLLTTFQSELTAFGQYT